MLRTLIVLMLFVVAMPAHAEMPAGHDDPRFKAAVEAWLDGNDEAMNAIYDLAGRGNVAALIAYHRFGKRSSALSHPRIDYKWLDYAKDSPLGLGFGITWENLPTRTPAEEVSEFVALGEHRWAAELVRREASKAYSRVQAFSIPERLVERVLGRQLDPLDRLLTFFAVSMHISDRTYISVLRDLCAEANLSPAKLGVVVRYCQAVAEGDRQAETAIRAGFAFYAPKYDPFDHGRKLARDWLAVQAELPQHRLCQRICSNQLSDCAIAVWLQTGQVSGLVSLGSPVETLVPQETYLASLRVDLELWGALSRARALFHDYGLDTGWSEAPSCVLRALDSGDNPWRQTSE